MHQLGRRARACSHGAAAQAAAHQVAQAGPRLARPAQRGKRGWLVHAHAAIRALLRGAGGGACAHGGGGVRRGDAVDVVRLGDGVQVAGLERVPPLVQAVRLDGAEPRRDQVTTATPLASQSRPPPRGACSAQTHLATERDTHSRSWRCENQRASATSLGLGSTRKAVRGQGSVTNRMWSTSCSPHTSSDRAL